MKNVIILGATGSIGKQALEVIKMNPDRFSVKVLTAQNNAALLIEQAMEYLPEWVVIGNEAKYLEVKNALAPIGITVFCGEDGIGEAATYPHADLVLSALVGAVGLKPTLAAIHAGKNIALANKETLVVAGELIMQLAKKKGINLIPVDSEHSAIFQCLVGEEGNQIEKIYLTASGGPFLGKTRNDLLNVDPKMALKHPNWVMGSKITIDSASLMNKGLEVIEAAWLFGLKPEEIKVVVHPQSVVHSLVQFNDGSLKAQWGMPDMKLPIQYALSWPNRLENKFPRFNFLDYPNLQFLPPDSNTFRNLELAYQAMRKGGNTPCILNAANEIAVEAFLAGNLGFLEMSDLIEMCMNEISFQQEPSLKTYLETDKHTRIFAADYIANIKKHT